MESPLFPVPLTEVVDTAIEVFRHQGRGELVEIFQKAHARFDATDYDSWDGGITGWTLRLEIPVALFAAIDSRLSEVEQEILGKLSYLKRLHPRDPLGEVTITPHSNGKNARGERMIPSDLDVAHIWEGHFRLFVSHLDKYKVQVANLKSELSYRGVSSFVAHKDIEPSREWQHQIELGLRSMHALTALITPDFHGSNWTDQEVGWALGRGVPVINVRLGKDPYGLAGKYQGVSGSLDEAAALATAIVEAILTNPQTHGEMKRSLVRAFAASMNFSMSLALCPLIVKITDITDEEKVMLWTACSENDQVYNAHRVQERIYTAIGRPPEAENESDADLPF